MPDIQESDALKARIVMLTYIKWQKMGIRADVIPKDLQDKKYVDGLERDFLQKDLSSEAIKWTKRILDPKDNDADIRMIRSFGSNTRLRSGIPYLANTYAQLKDSVDEKALKTAMTAIVQRDALSSEEDYANIVGYFKKEGITLEGLQSPATGMQFNQLIFNLLESEEGVFLGEEHKKAAVRQVLTYIAPALGVNKVRTIALEMPQFVLDQLKDQPLDKVKPQLEAHWKLLKAGERNGFKVIGYEMPLDEKSKKIVEKKEKLEEEMADNEFENPELMKKLRKEYQELAEEYKKVRGNPEYIAKRDDYAVDFIKKNKLPGKYIVVGGGLHSGKFGEHELNGEPGGEMLGKGYKGLNVKLGIPAIDFVEAFEEKDYGKTLKSDGKYNDYRAFMPADLNVFLRYKNIDTWVSPPPVLLNKDKNIKER